MSRSEAGSASIAVVGGAMLVLVIGLLMVDVGVYTGARARAVGAADAAALAAAPVTFRRYGSGGGPHVEAGRFAAANGATLMSCNCPFDPTWAARTVETTVTLPVSLLLLGDRTVTATSRAEFVPTESILDAAADRQIHRTPDRIPRRRAGRPRCLSRSLPARHPRGPGRPPRRCR